MKNLLAVVGGRPLEEEVKKNWSSSLLQAKGMGKSTDEGGHFSAVSLSLSLCTTQTLLPTIGFLWRASRGHGHPWSPCSSVPAYTAPKLILIGAGVGTYNKKTVL